MVEELQAAREFFKLVDDELEPLTRQILTALGINTHLPEMMEELRLSGFGEPLPGL